MQKEKIKNIEFLRFFFVLDMFLMHFLCNAGVGSPLLHNLSRAFLPSMLLVGFFFITSGFFFAYTYKEQNFFEFVTKKIKRLFPVLALFVLSIFALSQYNIVEFSPYEGLYMLTFLNSVGISSSWGLTAWFTSVLFWSLLFYFGLRRVVKDNTLFCYIVSIITFITYVAHYSMVHVTPMGNNEVALGIISSGMLLALADIGLGILIYFVWINLPNASGTKKEYWFYTIAELLVLAWIIVSCCVTTLGSFTGFIYTLFFAALFILFVLKRGFISKLLDNDISVLLGKYAFSFYMIHWALLKLIDGVYWYKNASGIIKYPLLNLLGATVIVLILTFFTYHLVEKESKYRKYVFAVVLVIALLPATIFHYVPLKYGKVYKFNRSNPYVYVSSRYDITPMGLWFAGNKTRIYSRLQKGKNKITYRFEPYLTPENPIQNITVMYKKKEIANWTFKYGEPYPDTYIIVDTKGFGLNSVKFLMPDAVYQNSNGRSLSVLLKSMKVEKVN